VEFSTANATIVKLLAHVHRLDCEEDPLRRNQAQHDRSALTNVVTLCA